MSGMHKWAGRVVLVTGASAGIGAAIAERLVKAGMVTVGCATRLQPMEEMAERLRSEQGKLIPVKCDLRNESEILAMFDLIHTKYGGVDVCINNAGVSLYAPFFSGNYDDWRNMLSVNVMALGICSQESLQSMKAREVDDGMIIHISSMSAHRAGANFYSATKYAVNAMMQGMRNELAEMESNIRVSGISPGLVETELAYRRLGARAKELYGSIKCLQPNDIADAVEYVMSAPPHVSVNDILIKPTQQAV